MRASPVGNTLLGNIAPLMHIKEDQMPKSAIYTLTWSSSPRVYKLYSVRWDNPLDLIFESPTWSTWVSQLSSFAFHGQHGSYTARKERRRRGEYWYAYARVEGKLNKRYLGRSTDLTLTRLEQVAQELWLDPRAAVRQGEGRASSWPLSLAPLDQKVFLPDYLRDYVLDEVLSLQRPAVQDFLLHTCILPRLSAPLCDALRADHDSQTLLQEVEQANLFLVSLDDQLGWFRYHPLVAEVLRQRLRQTAPTLIPELHLRASRWYAQQGCFSEAASQALAAGAVEEVARLIQQHLGTFPEAFLPARSASALVEPLTARERDVLRLVLREGASNRQIAQQLVLSVNTVKKHLANLYGKLNVQSRAQAIAKAHRLQLV